MQDVLQESASLLPGIVKSDQYPKLLESLILEVPGTLPEMPANLVALLCSSGLAVTLPRMLVS